MLERILELIKRKNLTAKEFCKALNFPLTAVTDWKNGKSKPTVSQVIAMAEFFGVTTDYILLGLSLGSGSQNIEHSFNNSPHSTITISNGTSKTFELNDFEKELFRIFQNLDTKNKTALLAYGYKLENEQRVPNDSKQ